jgi:hypothetical protein
VTGAAVADGLAFTAVKGLDRLVEMIVTVRKEGS